MPRLVEQGDEVAKFHDHDGLLGEVVAALRDPLELRQRGIFHDIPDRSDLAAGLTLVDHRRQPHQPVELAVVRLNARADEVVEAGVPPTDIVQPGRVGRITEEELALERHDHTVDRTELGRVAGDHLRHHEDVVLQTVDVVPEARHGVHEVFRARIEATAEGADALSLGTWR